MAYLTSYSNITATVWSLKSFKFLHKDITPFVNKVQKLTLLSTRSHKKQKVSCPKVLKIWWERKRSRFSLRRCCLHVQLLTFILWYRKCITSKENKSSYSLVLQPPLNKNKGITTQKKIQTMFVKCGLYFSVTRGTTNFVISNVNFVVFFLSLSLSRTQRAMAV